MKWVLENKLWGLGLRSEWKLPEEKEKGELEAEEEEEQEEATGACCEGGLLLRLQILGE